MLSCSEVTRLYASDEIQRASVTKRLQVRLHLLMCRFCRRYFRELAAIGGLARSVLGGSRSNVVDASGFERHLLEQIANETKNTGEAGDNQT